MKQHPYILLVAFALLLFLWQGCTSCGNNYDPEKAVSKEIKIIPFGTFSSNFNDMNPAHLKAAKTYGIPLLETRDNAAKHRSKLKKVESCDLYDVEKLTHSVPYLVPRAHKLLETICQAFADTIESRGGSGYKPIVTSVLRTQEDIKRLQKGNINASSNSAHCYGTTFDIAYSRFGRTDYNYDIPQAQVKHILAEVLRNLKRSGECYVRYEVKQGCFHITTR